MPKMLEVSTLVTQSLNRVDDANAQTMLIDVLNGVNVAQQNAAIKFLPATMKEVLVEGLEGALTRIADVAWDYYSEHDVPENQHDVLRTLVEYHLFKGSVTV